MQILPSPLPVAAGAKTAAPATAGAKSAAPAAAGAAAVSPGAAGVPASFYGAAGPVAASPGKAGALAVSSGKAASLPVSSSAAGGRTAGVDAQGFSRLLRQHLEGSPATITPLANGLADSNAHSAVVALDDVFASQAPYLKTNAKNDATRNVQEIRFTPAEVRKIAKALQESGVDPAVAQEIMKLAGNPMGVTAPDMLKAMAEVVRKPAQITDGDMVRISSLLQRLDQEGALSGQILADVRNGKTTQAWQKILGALNALDQNSPVALERDEILSLGKCLGLSDRTLDVLHKAFGGNSRVELNPKQVEQFLTSLQHELGERQAQTEKLAAAFEKALSPVAQEARMRIAAEESAKGRTTRSVQHSVVLIEDTVTRNGLTRRDSVNAPQEEAAAATPVTSARGGRSRRNSANSPQAKATAATPKAPDATQHAAAATQHTVAATQNAAAATRDGAPRGGALRQDGANAPQVEGTAAAQRPENLLYRGSDEAAYDGGRREGADAGNQHKRSAWADFTDRVRYQDAGAPQQDRASDILPGVSLMPVTSQSGQATQSVAQPVLPPYAPQVLRQVEQGLLTGMRDGSQRLELQLTPEHLGALTMVLTVKNGEISALLRPERSETAALLSQQTDQLRFTLEQQGIKVDKVEVQVQDGRANTWQGMEQHNASQEQQTRAEQGRILRLGRLHRNDANGLDQKMHEVGHGGVRSADHAGGLYIIT